MFKILYINILPIFIITLIFTTLSCDGRGRKQNTNTEILTKNKLLDSFSEKVEYIPETYIETTIDTVFSNGIIAKTTFYSDMENTISTEKTVDSITHKTFYRELVVDVKIDLKNKSIFNKKINKSYLVKEGVFNNKEAELYIINDYNISSYKDVNNDYPILALHFLNIETKKIKIIRFFFLEDKSFFEIVT